MTCPSAFTVNLGARSVALPWSFQFGQTNNGRRVPSHFWKIWKNWGTWWRNESNLDDLLISKGTISELKPFSMAIFYYFFDSGDGIHNFGRKCSKKYPGLFSVPISYPGLDYSQKLNYTKGFYLVLQAGIRPKAGWVSWLWIRHFWQHWWRFLRQKRRCRNGR